MIDFPASPTTGQIFTAAGASWRYDGTKWVAYGVGSSNDVGRNLVHNAMFNVQQRGAGPWTSGYTLDRWWVGAVSDTISFSQQVLSDSDRVQIGDEAAVFSLQNVFTGNAAAGAYNQLIHRVENVRRLSNKTVILSFWAKAAAGAPKLGINLVEVMGSGGSPSSNVTALATGIAITLSATWTRYTATVAMPSIAGLTLGTNGDSNTAVTFGFSSGATNNAFFGNIGVQSGTINIWGVQLEVGTQATPLEKIDPGEDLRRCQRFYQVGTAGLFTYAAAGFGFSYLIPLPVTPRSAPTYTTSGVTYSNASGVIVGAFGSGATMQAGATATALGLASVYFNWTASADL